MNSRLIQLFARYVGLAGVSIAVWVLPDVTEEQKGMIGGFATTIATAVVGFIGLLTDLLIHRMNNGGFLASAKNGGMVSPVNAAKMATLAMLLVPAAILVSGCAPGAGQSAREGLLAPIAVQQWELIEPLALRGIADMVEDDELTEGTAAFPRETIRLFDEAVGQLGGE